MDGTVFLDAASRQLVATHFGGVTHVNVARLHFDFLARAQRVLALFLDFVAHRTLLGEDLLVLASDSGLQNWKHE